MIHEKIISAFNERVITDLVVKAWIIPTYFVCLAFQICSRNFIAYITFCLICMGEPPTCSLFNLVFYIICLYMYDRVFWQWEKRFASSCVKEMVIRPIRLTYSSPTELVRACGCACRWVNPTSPDESPCSTMSVSVHVLFVYKVVLRNPVVSKDGVLTPIPQYPLYSALGTLLQGELVPYYLEVHRYASYC
jgi:hypothetical protein